MSEEIAAYPTAPVALILSVPLTFALFSAFPPHRAAFASLLGAALLLPVGYGWQLPGVTFLDKETIPLLSAILACLLTAPREFRHLRLQGWTLGLVAAIAASSMATALTNGDDYSFGGAFMQGLTLWDGVGLLRERLFQIVLPFLLGRMLIRDVRQLEQMLRALAFGFLVYSLPMLWEVRMSPQLHNTVYGYLPYSFAQQVRAGGFRPVVFVGHGLPLAIMTSFAVLASAILWRRRRKIGGLPAATVTLYLGAVVALCKTLSAVLYASAGTAAGFFASAKTQLRAGVAIACIALAYPLLRTLDVFPTAVLTEISDSASKDRSESLAFRFENEDILLKHAWERPLFGWGGYGRNRVLNEEGTDTSVTDGFWIILIGQLGVVGFASVFGLMLLPIFQCGRAVRNVGSGSDRRMLASCALLIALNWADSLPNAMSGGLMMVFATGAFSGVVETYQTARATRPQPKKAATPLIGALPALPGR
jgi:hypothetical protein